MEQHDAGLTELKRKAMEQRHTNVPRRDGGAADAFALQAILDQASSEPVATTRLDLMRKAMLVFAGLLTLLWVAALGRGASWLLGTLFF
jgi:hypothetical protein